MKKKVIIPIILLLIIVIVLTNGYKLVSGDRCIGEKTANKNSGKVCDEIDSRLVGDYCVMYEIVDAKHY